jgi:uncharacterized membrane protein YeiH
VNTTQSAAEWWALNGALVFEGVGIVAFAVSGLIEAARKRLDFVGMAVVAALTAFGGGTLRDILLDRRPFFWVQNVNWIYGILAICILAMVFLRGRHIALTERAIIWPDAIGLAIFTAGGTQLALATNSPPIVAVILGTLSAAFGGVLRDIVVNEIPRAFSDHQPYSIVAFVGAWIVVLGAALNWPSLWSLAGSAGFIVVVRMLAVKRGWRLPEWKV